VFPGEASRGKGWREETSCLHLPAAHSSLFCLFFFYPHVVCCRRSFILTNHEQRGRSLVLRHHAVEPAVAAESAPEVLCVEVFLLKLRPLGPQCTSREQLCSGLHQEDLTRAHLQQHVSGGLVVVVAIIVVFVVVCGNDL